MKFLLVNTLDQTAELRVEGGPSACRSAALESPRRHDVDAGLFLFP
ncbi:MAG: hypothetical protein AAB551_01380 [Patescibacteria group bacterium]